MESSDVLDAAFYAAHKHAGQRRKGTAAEPYINHLLEVAAIVSDSLNEPDPNLIIAALLHDTVEDTDVTPADLEERYGKDVASLVAEVTDDNTLSKQERKRLQVVNAAKKSPRAQRIKLADKISNLRSILDSPPVDWTDDRKREYFDWARQVVDALPNPHPGLKAEFDRVYSSFPKK